jgi:hypothetical protein
LNTSTVGRDSVYRTVFQQHWWLESVTEGEYHEVSVRSGDVTQGWLPYVTRRRWGYLVSGMPLLTHSLGPVVLPGTGNSTSEFLRHNSITSDLLAQLPKLAHFRQVLSSDDRGALGSLNTVAMSACSSHSPPIAPTSMPHGKACATRPAT